MRSKSSRSISRAWRKSSGIGFLPGPPGFPGSKFLPPVFFPSLDMG